MKSIVFIMTALISFQAFSGCIEDFRGLQNKKEVDLVRIREVEVQNTKGFKKLREAELKAVKNYIDYLDFEFDGENSIFVTTEQYQSKDQYRESLGYKISVTDGGDESNVRYYMKIVVGIESVSYPILYRIWDNQSMEAKFLCERY